MISMPGRKPRLLNRRDFDHPAWMKLGACVDKRVSLFYPDLAGRSRIDGEAAGKAVCAECPVIAKCREYAITNHECGIWGGTNDFERRRVRSLRARGIPVSFPLPARKQRDPVPLPPINHGTEGGAKAHLRRGIPICEPCRVERARAQSDRTKGMFR